MAKRNKILIADDMPANREVYTSILESEFPNYSIEAFKDGNSLVSRIEEGVNDVGMILTDNQMPGINGSDIIAKYAINPEFGVPFILVTGDGKDVGEEACKNGAFGYLLKPFGFPQFTDLVNRALNYVKE